MTNRYYRSALVLSVSFVVLFLVLVNALFWLLKSQIGKAIDAHLNDNLLRVGNLVAQRLDEYNSQWTEWPDSKYLDSLRLDLELDEIYILDTTGNSITDARSQIASGLEYAITLTDTRRWQQALQGEASVSPTIVFEGERFKNVYVPIGSPVQAILVLEISPTYLYILDRITASIIWLGIVSIIIAVILLIFLRKMILMLIESEQRLREGERLAIIGKFAAGLAHEMRNPLGIISSTAELMQKDLHTQFTKDILDEVDRLENIIKEFLNLAAPKSPKIQNYNVLELMDAVIKRWSRKAEGITISVTHDQLKDITITADTQLFNRIFDNLFSNTCTFCKAPGSIRINLASTSHHIIINFEDSGPISKPLDITRIFEPFFTTRHEGTGLGLAIVQSSINALQGSIKAYYATLGGLGFEIRFPKETTK